jgi:hypothetical protein
MFEKIRLIRYNKMITGGRFFLFLVLLTSALMNNMAIVREDLKESDCASVLDNPDTLHQKYIISGVTGENYSSIICAGNEPLISASILDLTSFNHKFPSNTRSSDIDSTKKIRTEEYLSALQNDNFTGSRATRLYYSWIIFNDYALFNKIFGGGFDYLEKYGTKFEVTRYDYPHNPIISAFLYSGIIGGLFYIWFLIMVFYYYIKYRKFHMFFLICFLVTFFFSIVSADTHFSIPIFTIFCMIPFLTRYFIVKGELPDSKNDSDAEIIESET